MCATGHARARYLYAIARNVQKHMRILAVIESMDNGTVFLPFIGTLCVRAGGRVGVRACVCCTGSQYLNLTM